MIRMFHVYKSYGDREVLHDINLEVSKGEFVFLVGPSGAGKSTLLRLIYMEEFPTQGQVEVNGYSSVTIKRRQIPYLRRRIGVIFQDFKLLADRNVFENVAFALQVTGVGRGEIKRRVFQTLIQVGMSHRRYAMPYELSGGEWQRVSIARALVHDPVVLLADEPTGNLDREATVEVMDLLGRINSRGTAILMATHDMDLVRNFPYRVIYLREGRIVGR